ncbi:unnamed protein product, partial [marine sediment metagenome]
MDKQSEEKKKSDKIWVRHTMKTSVDYLTVALRNNRREIFFNFSAQPPLIALDD